MSGPRRSTRLAVAVAMTLWAVLQAATLVVAALGAGGPRDPFTFTYTGMFTMVLVVLCVVAWRWVGRATGYLPPPPAGEPTARTPAQAVEPQPGSRSHHGLRGQVPPPRRW